MQILQEQAGGVAPAELIRRHCVSMDTLHRWPRKYSGVNRTEVQRPKALEEENRRLKRLVAEQAHNGLALKDALGKTR